MQFSWKLNFSESLSMSSNSTQQDPVDSLITGAPPTYSEAVKYQSVNGKAAEKHTLPYLPVPVQQTVPHRHSTCTVYPRSSYSDSLSTSLTSCRIWRPSTISLCGFELLKQIKGHMRHAQSVILHWLFLPLSSGSCWRYSIRSICV